MTIRVRFAPSPTGMLHIGNVRTAIFNFLFAKSKGGKFLIRIEDTDSERNTQEAVDAIFDGLDLLGLEYDEDPVFQSDNKSRHLFYANKLLEEGKAYKCFHSAEELDIIRKNNKNKVVSKWRDASEDSHPNSPFVIRLKTNNDGITEIDDMVQGKVSINNSEIDDLILVRSDGSPTYHLAVVVDDNDAAITHVIRGNDHLTNTFRQLSIINALEFDVPSYGHLPLINDESGKKLSKRNSAVSLTDFLMMGYLPNAIINYLVKLGWSDTEEFLSMDDLINRFDISKVGKSPSNLDYKKLTSINSYWIKQMPPEEVCIYLEGYAANKELDIDGVYSIIDSIIERAETFVQMVDLVKYMDDNWFEGATFDLSKFDNETIELTKKLFNKEWENKEDMMSDVKSFCGENNIKVKDCMAIIRGLVCKSSITPPIFDVIISLEERFHERLNR